MTELVLKKIGKHFGVEPWLEKEDDFLVLNNTGRIVGRIVMRACSPKGRPWVWTILHANCALELSAPYKSGPSKAWLKIKNPKAPTQLAP